MEVLTDGVALLFSVLSVTQQFVGAFLPDTSETIPLQQEDNFLQSMQHVFMCACSCPIRCITKERNDAESRLSCLPISRGSVWNLRESRIHPLHCLIHSTHTHTHAYSCRICCYATRLLMDFCFDSVYPWYEMGKERKIVG